MAATIARRYKIYTEHLYYNFPTNSTHRILNCHILGSLCSYFAKNDYSANRKSSAINAAEYCLDLVKKYDYENYLCLLLLPTEVRSAAFAIRAFNIEIAQIQDLVSHKDIGKMRMQFWKDTLERIYQEDPPHQPVAREMTRILKRQPLTKQWFKRLIASREEMLTKTSFDDITAVEEYSEHSVSSVYYLILESAGVKNIHADHCASHLGKAQGITNVLRGIPFNAKRNRTYLPQEAMLKHQVSQEDVIRGRSIQNVKDLVFDVACVANQHITKARSFKKDIPKSADGIFLPAVATGEFLKRLQRVDFDIFNPRLQLRNSFLPISLWWHNFKGIY